MPGDYRRRVLRVSPFGFAPWLALAVAIVAASGAWLFALGHAGPAILVGVGACAAALAGHRRQRDIDAIGHRLQRLLPDTTPGPPPRDLDGLVTAVEHRLAEAEVRLLHRHRITGLPTREPLLRQMNDDGHGVLGIVALRDFKRMCAFDEALGERTIAILVERVRRMVGAGRFVAHVDRAQIAIWFGGAVVSTEADAALDAVAYALGDQIADAETDTVITPDVRVVNARLPEDGATADAVLRRAIALLSADGAPIANPVAVARDRYAIEQDLRRAIARGEFELLFQPLVDAGNGCVAGAEALLRWHHPDRGLISPAQFIPLAEAAGLADDVGLWALNTACREARAWQNRGLSQLYVAVNVSGHQLDRPDMRNVIQRTLARHSLAASRLQIELTETVAAGETKRAQHLFEGLRAMGVRIAIDDFGTGYSSLSALRRLTFDKIKIDREFVTDVDTRPDSQAICQSIIALGRGLGINILAEGVERAEEYRWLLTHGCQRFQGYYFSKPLTSAAFASFVADRAQLTTLLGVDPRTMRRAIKERLTA